MASANWLSAKAAGAQGETTGGRSFRRCASSMKMSPSIFEPAPAPRAGSKNGTIIPPWIAQEQSLSQTKHEVQNALDQYRAMNVDCTTKKSSRARSEPPESRRRAGVASSKGDALRGFQMYSVGSVHDTVKKAFGEFSPNYGWDYDHFAAQRAACDEAVAKRAASVSPPSPEPPSRRSSFPSQSSKRVLSPDLPQGHIRSKLFGQQTEEASQTQPRSCLSRNSRSSFGRHRSPGATRQPGSSPQPGPSPRASAMQPCPETTAPVSTIVSQSLVAPKSPVLVRMKSRAAPPSHTVTRVEVSRPVPAKGVARPGVGDYLLFGNVAEQETCARMPSKPQLEKDNQKNTPMARALMRLEASTAAFKSSSSHNGAKPTYMDTVASNTQGISPSTTPPIMRSARLSMDSRVLSLNVSHSKDTKGVYRRISEVSTNASGSVIGDGTLSICS